MKRVFRFKKGEEFDSNDECIGYLLDTMIGEKFMDKNESILNSNVKITITIEKNK